MADLSALIAGSDKLRNIFGRWPSFHDAEVHEILLDRGHVAPTNGVYDFPRLTAKIHLWLLTNEVNEKGYYVTTKHTLATIKFYDVDELKLEGFNHQNAIFGLGIEQKTRDQGPSPYFAVDFDPAFGISATFTCLRIEVVDAVLCDAEGNI
jgi:hypothetical protein